MKKNKKNKDEFYGGLPTIPLEKVKGRRKRSDISDLNSISVKPHPITNSSIRVNPHPVTSNSSYPTYPSIQTNISNIENKIRRNYYLQGMAVGILLVSLLLLCSIPFIED